MLNSTAEARKFRNRGRELKKRADTVIDASGLFLARRKDADRERQAAAIILAWEQANDRRNSLAAQSASQVVRTLKPRIERDATRVFILAKDGIVLDENGVRCVPFTVVPAPRYPEDDRRYLMPYFQRGWSCILFPDPDDPSLPCAMQKATDPDATFEAAVQDLPAEKRNEFRRPSGYRLYHSVPDPLG